jgi:hypothetical protein
MNEKINDKSSKRTRTGSVLLFAFLVLAFIAEIFFIYSPKNAKVTYGVTFSKQYAEYLGVDWKQNYLALLDDLKVRNFRLPVYWSEIEANRGNYYFDNVDWELEQAKARNAKVILVVGMKQPRWPECHMPDWAKGLVDTERQKELDAAITATVNRYKDNPAVTTWQVENEPYLPYGECPKIDSKILEEEIAIVRKLDPSRPIMVTDSGELSTWYGAATHGDILGTTLYRIVWSNEIGYVHYPIASIFYRLKAALITYMTHVKKIVIVELQAEPWSPTLVIDTPLEEQYKSMNAEQLRKNVEYVDQVEFSEAYLWGAEWWYWLKINKGDSSLWEEARKIF